MVMLLLRGGAQRRNLWKMLMPKAGKFSPWIWIDQTLTHHCDSNKGTPLVALRVYKKGNIFRPMMERQFDDIIIMSMFCILIHIIVPFQIFLFFIILCLLLMAASNCHGMFVAPKTRIPSVSLPTP